MYIDIVNQWKKVNKKCVYIDHILNIFALKKVFDIFFSLLYLFLGKEFINL